MSCTCAVLLGLDGRVEVLEKVQDVYALGSERLDATEYGDEVMKVLLFPTAQRSGKWEMATGKWQMGGEKTNM